MTDLSVEQLLWFSNGFLRDFCQACIAIENFQGSAYPTYYEGFWSYYNDFIKKREDFEKDEKLDTVFSYFYDLITPYVTSYSSIGDIPASLKSKPTSGDECILQLHELRELEESRIIV